MERIGLRAAGRLVDCSHGYIKRLADAGRLHRDDKGLFDPAEVIKVAAQSDPGLKRKTPVNNRNTEVTPRNESPRQRLPLPQADLDSVWHSIARLPELAAWSIATHGGTIELAHHVAADMVLDITGNLRLRGFAAPPVPLEPITWSDLCEEFGLLAVDPADMADEWERKRQSEP